MAEIRVLVDKCTGCRKCRETRDNTCVFKDDAVNALIAKAEEADGFVFGTPVYFSHPSGALLSVLDRMFYAGAAVSYTHLTPPTIYSV